MMTWRDSSPPLDQGAFIVQTTLLIAMSRTFPQPPPEEDSDAAH